MELLGVADASLATDMARRAVGLAPLTIPRNTKFVGSGVVVRDDDKNVARSGLVALEPPDNQFENPFTTDGDSVGPLLLPLLLPLWVVYESSPRLVGRASPVKPIFPLLRRLSSPSSSLS